ncbi:hypothetical protein ACJX0J_036302, partial [Zea mays]
PICGYYIRFYAVLLKFGLTYIGEQIPLRGLDLFNSASEFLCLGYRIAIDLFSKEKWTGEFLTTFGAL